MTETPEHLNKTEARGGNSNPVNRVVLFVSLAVVIVVFGLLLLAKG